MVPEIWRVTDRIFCHFGSFFALCPSNNMKNQNSEKMKKKAWRYHHFTIVYQKSWSYATLLPRYGTWQMFVTDVIIFHFGLFFAILPPKTAPKINIFKTWKKQLEISLFYICVSKIMIRWRTVPEIWCVTNRQTDWWILSLFIWFRALFKAFCVFKTKLSRFCSKLSRSHVGHCIESHSGLDRGIYELWP